MKLSGGPLISEILSVFVISISTHFGFGALFIVFAFPMAMAVMYVRPVSMYVGQCLMIVGMFMGAGYKVISMEMLMMVIVIMAVSMGKWLMGMVVSMFFFAKNNYTNQH